jgi:hypothetical protein
MSIHSNCARAARRSAATFAALAALIPIIALTACDAAAPTESFAPRTLTPANAPPSTPAAMGAERYVYEALYDLQGSEVYVECSDGSVSEPVSLTGKIFERFTVVFDPAEGQHSVYHTMPVGLAGVGSVSGEEFRVSWRDHGVSSQTPMAMVNSYRHTLQFAGRTSGRRFGLVVQGHYTLDANGEVTVGREKLLADCEG